MRHTTSAVYRPRQDDCYLPARVARRLIARHGPTEAFRRAGRQLDKHRKRICDPATTRGNTPFLIIYWDIVALNVRKRLTPLPRPTVSAA